MNILVCGFMGSGKTTFVEGFRENSLGFECIDLDQALACSLGIMPTELGAWIKENTIEEFRQKEMGLLKDLLNNRMMKIIALGGGTIESDEYAELKTQAKTVFLNVPFKTCYNRIKNDSNRPLTAIGEAGLLALYNKRLATYLASDLCLNESEIKNIVSLSSLVHNLSRI